MTVLHLDIETFSERDLKREGLYRYAACPSTELLVVCYAFDDAPVQTWVPADDPLIPQDLYDHIVARGEVRAHNAGFERTVLNGAAGERLGFPKISIEQCVCTAAKAAAQGLPRALGDAAAALGTHAKDGAGRMDMLQLSKPRTGRILRWTPENAPERFERLYRYCADDVEAERGIDEAIPDLPPAEQAVYALDQVINDRGVAVDLEATEAALALIAEYKAELQARCIKITGVNPTQTGKLADWVRTHGYPSLPNLQADTVHHAVRDAACPDVVKTVLRLFSTYNAKAVTKYEAILRAAGEDARLRGMFLYHGAGTGRWASIIVQLQNLFRPVIEDTDRAIDIILQRDLAALRQAYPDHDPMRVLASCVRGMLVASSGRVLQSLDFSGNEARGNAWLFGEEWKLKAYRAFDEGCGPDLYKMAYSRAFRVDPESVDKQQRQIGKVMELALGYEGGANAFVTMAANYGVDLDEMASLVRQALHPTIVERSHFKWERFGAQTGLPYDTYIACDGLVQLWRDAHPRIVAGWKELRDAAADAVRHPGKVFAIRSRRIRFRVQGQWLYMRLPSGRCLTYFRPEVDESGALTYMGVDTYTRRWMRTATYGGKLCLAAGTQVLTDRGWVAIEQCSAADRLWDGVEWVLSGGLVAQGVRPVITYAGVDMTPDHEVLTHDGWKAAALAQSEGSQRAEVRLPDSSGLFGKSEWQDVLARTVRVRDGGARGRGGPDTVERPFAEVLRLQDGESHLGRRDPSREVEASDLCGVAQHGGPMLESPPPGVAQLRGARDSRLQGMGLVRDLPSGHVDRLPPGADAGPYRQQRALLQGELPLDGLEVASEQQAGERADPDALGPSDRGRSGATERRWPDHDLLPGRTRLAARKVSRTYDLVNAGPRKRFTVRGRSGEVLIVHNCENAVQALSRDLLVHAMHGLEAAGYETVMTVHDEIVSDIPEDHGSLEEASRIMCTLPAWAEGFPVAVEGWRARRYRK